MPRSRAVRSAVIAPPLTPSPSLAELSGAWSRSLLVTGNGRRDTTSLVTWLQAGPFYVDLRQPTARLPVQPLASLDVDALLLLAEQAGFAGVLTQQERAWVWGRTVDLQPASGRVDAGFLRLDGDLLVEDGRDDPYLEHWRRDASPTSPVAGAHLRDDRGRDAVVVRVGHRVGWARGHAEPLPPARTLAELVREAPDLVSARRLFDAEVALGAAAPDGRVVLQRSSLPGRTGARLDLSSWQVVDIVGDASALPLERTP